jgi:sigma-70-like protein
MNERTQEMAKLYRDDRLTMQEIGDRYGISRERVRQILAPLGLEMHYGARKHEEREARLREAHARIKAGESTFETEAKTLGYSSSERLRTAFWQLGLKLKRKHRGPQHGSLYRYSHLKCRCPKCRKAARDAYAERIAKGPTKHGTASSYRNYGCRCPRCKAAERLYQRKRKAEKRQAKEPVA